ncbi:MAG TPA: sensor histidine kinase [Candidatus Limnocylindria bacterium]
MSDPTKPAWERYGDAMVNWCGYVLLAIATPLAFLAGSGDPAGQAITLAISAGAAAWIHVMYSRLPPPRPTHRLRIGVFFVGLLVLASILMLRQPAYFIFMISGFFYASILRPMPLAFVGVGATSILVNTLIAGFPPTAEGVTFYAVIIVIQTLVIGTAVVIGEKVAEQSEERRRALAQLEAALMENAGLHAQLLTQAREAGVLDERARMAREIHDTIAQGLIGIVTQLEAADHAHDRPADRDRHLDNAERLARESLAEARRSVQASMPAALESGTLPDALADVAREWSEMNGIPADVTVTGDVIALHPEIEVALLRTAQEALANVARHAGASRTGLTLSFMGDVVTLDVRDDGIGFSVPEPDAGGGAGFGLTTMRQRIARVAGSLAIESEPGVGTALSARVPAIAASSSAASST